MIYARFGAPLTALLATALLSTAAAHAAPPKQQKGRVQAGGQPVSGATVTIYRAGSTRGSGAVALGSTTSNNGGQFKVKYDAPADPDAVLYLIAEGPADDLRLATVLGSGTPSKITINELSTVATAHAMAQFIDGAQIGGNVHGVRNAAATLRNIVDIRTGNTAKLLRTKPNGDFTSTMAAVNALANMLAACASDPSSCATLFALATPPDGGPAPGDTLAAAVVIARYSWNNAAELYDFSTQVTTYQPTLDAAPSTWAVALKYVGNGKEFDGPGNTAFDEVGNAWICQNYVFRRNHDLPSCAAEIVTKLTPDGSDFPGEHLDRERVQREGAQRNGWVTDNTNNLVLQLDPAGELIGMATPDAEVIAPMGIAFDSVGTIWLSNSGIVQLPCAGNAEYGEPMGGNGPIDGPNPFASVLALNPDGSPIPGAPFKGGGLTLPWGIAVDGDDNVWVANFANKRVSHIRGNNPATWPAGASVGAPIAPEGYPSDALMRNTGVTIDLSGNVWLTNNWLDDAPSTLTNPGGDAMVVFVGLAAPVKTPLLGPPRQP